MKKTRFAPSPTGNLHIGNLRTALVAFLYVKSFNGSFILRIDDTDLERSDNKFVSSIKDDLLCMGIVWDDIFHQSDRFYRYREILQYLLKEGRVYECYETQEELDIKRKALLKSGMPPIYDRASLKLSELQRNELKNSARKSYFRFKLDRDDIISWDDGIHGEIKVNLSNTSDPIVVRSDGLFTYMLPSMVDDIDYAITDIIRGDDHITNTAVQIQMMKALEASLIPRFMHLPLLKSATEKISKRLGGYEVSNIINSGIEPIALASYLVNVGSSAQMEAALSIHDLMNNFDIDNFSVSSPVIDLQDIKIINKKLIQKLPFTYVKEKFDIEESFWGLIKNNLSKLNEIELWNEVCYGDVVLSKPKNIELINFAIQLLNEDEKIKYSQWISLIKSKIGNLPDINQQIRLAITGLSYGPEMSKLFDFISREKILQRLKMSLSYN